MITAGEATCAVIARAHQWRNFLHTFPIVSPDSLGSYITFVLAFAIVVVWAVTGPFFNFSTTWQLAINTGTTIVTFLMVFLIQNTQNRDGTATQLKLDEIIRAIAQADDELIDTEDATENELKELKARYKQLIRTTRT